MKTIIIKTQKEFDDLPDKFDEYTIIEIRASERITITKKRGNSRAELRENSSAVLRENSSAVLWENSSAALRENSSAVLWGNSSAVLWGNSLVKIYSDLANIKQALQESVVIVQGCKPKLPKKIKHLIRTKNARTTKSEFLKIFKGQVKDGKITLYKSVDPKNDCDFYTGKIKYEVGKTVECPDWNPDKTMECGGGLHLSPTLKEALLYNKGKILKCAVDLKDFVVYAQNITKVRCRKVKVIEEVKK